MGTSPATVKLRRQTAYRGSRHGTHATAGLSILLFLLAWSGGCREHRPLAPLTNTYPSNHALAQAVLDALSAADYDRLATLALNGQEFRDVVWPELPSSNPDRGLPVSYAWNDLNQKSTNGLRRLLARWGGHTFELLDVTFDGETTEYESFLVHRETRLTLRDTDGDELDVHFFGSTLVHNGNYKVFSYVVD